MVINGMLLNNHQDEAKYATVINSYGESIKENYFKDMDNIVTLGDPRMDIYANIEKNNINREVPTITIGASGFNPVVLNSYVAVEFDFMYDILSAFKTLRQKGEKFNIIIKVRPNGYKQQYLDFSKDYFKDLSITIESTAPMIEVLKKTDFYISIYSQTLFEASCLGIPVVYYKKDTEINNKPFNGKSELVTIDNKNDLIQAFYDFQNKHERYKLFLDRKIMEKYIGFLDGKNLERNLEFIENILNNGIDNVEMA
jgi:UDP-N-acetylglucosamine 2-epimerase